ncbi:lysozyme 2-like [Uranotaenia lowii]|uniref:lysozyme 2-like n=1 Tax=Uranotaenia lowii TaxID=190385 RepID=UPI0024792CC7|nr:lysozyme 2-like [Uranotaenia lowii]
MAMFERAVMTALTLFILLAIFSIESDGIFLSNLDATCFRCICEPSTGCSPQLKCNRGYCGPFSISRAYWIDSGKVVKERDDADRWGAYEDCANEYECATAIITQYMEKYGKDCNNDGLVDCVDYAMLHINGGPTCHTPLNADFRRKFGRCLQQGQREPLSQRSRT